MRPQGAERPMKVLLCLMGLLFLASSALGGPQDSSEKDLSYRVIHTYPHDVRLFTQGLAAQGGLIYESSGLYGRSLIKIWDLRTGRILQKRRLEDRFFGEGLTLLDDKIIQLTWREGTGFVYERKTLVLLKTFRYKGEGWGVAFDGSDLILSDGSSTLRFLSPHGFGERKRLEVRDNRVPVSYLNELEYVEGEILANIWQQDRIAKICPKSGRVKAWIDMGGLRDLSGAGGPEAVLNGIAYDRDLGKLFVTGKNWPRLFEIELVKKR